MTEPKFDVQLTFDPPAAWDQLPADVIARIDRLTEDLAALGTDWFIHLAWGDTTTGTHSLLATPTTNQTGDTK